MNKFGAKSLNKKVPQENTQRVLWHYTRMWYIVEYSLFGRPERQKLDLMNWRLTNVRLKDNSLLVLEFILQNSREISSSGSSVWHGTQSANTFVNLSSHTFIFWNYGSWRRCMYVMTTNFPECWSWMMTKMVKSIFLELVLIPIDTLPVCIQPNSIQASGLDA
jgi:hypothetical protein